MQKSPKCRVVSISNLHEMDQLACQIEACIKRFGFQLRFCDLDTFADSKLHKCTLSRHLSVKGAGSSLRLACKFSNGKSASRHVQKRSNLKSRRWGTRARSERPQAGREKYTKVLGDDMPKQYCRCLRSKKN